MSATIVLNLHSFTIQTSRAPMKFAFTPLHLIALLFNLLPLQQETVALTSDGIVLLSFKYNVLSDPLSVFNSWNYNDITPCSWTGVSCTQSSQVDSSDQMRVISLVLPNSQLSGFLSPHLSLISTLQQIDLSGNSFKGSIPLTILNAPNLQKLNLANNVISGEIPTLIGALPNLKFINLSSNSLTGQIPSGFKFVEVLDLSSNSLTGSIPANFDGGKLKVLDLSRNNISGQIPPQFGINITDDAMIDISFNNLTGEIPQTVLFQNQKSEAFAGNAGLCGKPLPLLCSIPSSQSFPPSPRPPHELNTSSAAIAAIPDIITSNPVLDAPQSSNEGNQWRLQPTVIAGIVASVVTGLALLGIGVFFVHRTNKRKTIDKPESISQPPVTQSPIKKSLETQQIITLQNLSTSLKHHRPFCAWPCWTSHAEYDTADSASSYSDHEPQPQTGRSGVIVSVDNAGLEMESLLKASASILGTSNSSIVYKAVMQDGRAFAVRRISEGCLKKMKEFETQIRGIAKLRHPNLVRTLGFYWGDDEKLIIYNFLPNGSLASFLNNRRIGASAIHLNLEKRLRIARGLARGMAFIHDKKQTHGNIKPSNVLLDSNLEPLISDFGLDRLILKPKFGSMRSSSSNEGLLEKTGSSGGGSPYTAGSSSSVTTSSSPYHAPELMRITKPSIKSDVYSFGVVLLELLTGKAFHEFELAPWTAASFTAEEVGRLLMMVDVAIRDDVAARKDATLTCMKLGFSCASLAPAKRPTMREALLVLENIEG